MNFPRFWARGTSGDFHCWHWSAESLADAQTLATQAAQRLAERIRSGDYPDRHWAYYPNRPFREQVMQEIKNAAGENTAVVTRNSYGCLVLNTARVMFVDIDLPEPKSAGGFFKKLFGKPAPAPPSSAHTAAVTKIEDWTRANSGWGWRIYRTRAGLRLLAMPDVVAPDSTVAARVFEELHADPLYRKLCQVQKCYRARLTPKPWRCGQREKPERWPFLDAKSESKFQKWETQYQAVSANSATCEFLTQIGNPAIHPEVQSILQLHDDSTRATSKLPLA